MDATINNTIIILNNQEIKEAILNFAFKKQPELRPIGTKLVSYPKVLINISPVGAATFMDFTHIAENEPVAIVIVPVNDECSKP